MEQTELVVRNALHGRHRVRLLLAVAMSATLLACSSDGPAASDATSPSSAGDAGATTTSAAAADVTEPATSDAPTSDPTTDPSTDVTADPAGALPLPAPDGAAFYTPPDPIPGSAAGDLIWARPLDGAPVGTVGWQVLYRSESVAGQPIAVSGVVIGPLTAAPGTARPVLTWAHGTTGLADRCAPSLSYAQGGIEPILAQAVVLLGYTFVATDYEGLGTPGVHPYLVGQSEGRGVLDIVRAAGQLEGAGVTTESKVAIFGHSQGGHAALMAGELAATYAPELNVVGTVAGAPPGDIGLIESTLGSLGSSGNSLGGGFTLMIDAGYAAAYPDLPVDALVTSDGVDVLAQAAETCTAEAFALADANPGVQLDPTANADWARAFETNSPGNVAPSAPVLIIHGSADDVVPPILSELIEQDYCALGVQVQRIVYDGANHGTVITEGLADVQAWITDRMADNPAPSSC